MEQPRGPVGADPDVVQVLVVDDQPPFRAAARAVIARVPGFEVVADVPFGDHDADQAVVGVADLTVMDLVLHPTEGMHAEGVAAVHRHAGIQVCAERAVVFGIHMAQIHAQPRHAADAVGQ